MNGKLFVVVGGQFGSEGKGAVAGRIARDLQETGDQVIGVRVGGPNAGHTVYGVCPPGCEDDHLLPPHGGQPDRPHPWRLRQVPVSAVTVPLSTLVIAAGSEIDLGVLDEELQALDAAGYSASARLKIDSSATVLTPGHIDIERAADLSGRIGSTAKGIGAARAARIWREAQTYGQVVPGSGYNTSEMLHQNLDSGSHVVIEGTQGYGLGLHTQFYPQTTSGDCRAIDFLAQVGLSPWVDRVHRCLRVVVVLRANPIRVAGNSGPLVGETTWQALGQPEELTTVTRKVRRVGVWDGPLAAAALRANGHPSPRLSVAFTMVDAMEPLLGGRDGSLSGPELGHASAWCHQRSEELGRPIVSYIGTGPDTALVHEGIYA